MLSDSIVSVSRVRQLTDEERLHLYAGARTQVARPVRHCQPPNPLPLGIGALTIRCALARSRLPPTFEDLEAPLAVGVYRLPPKGYRELSAYLVSYRRSPRLVGPPWQPVPALTLPARTCRTPIVRTPGRSW